jgi:hypothetical protein
MSVRYKKRNPWILLVFGTVSVLLITFISVFFFGPTIPTRIGIAIVGSPTVVLSYDPIRKSLLGVSIPPDVTVDVVRGYGMYPVSSVWKLDSLDKRGGVVFTETLEEAIGIPIHFYIDAPYQNPSTKIEDHIQRTLSMTSVLKMLLDKKRTNIPPAMIVDLMRSYQSMSPTDMVFFDLDTTSVFVDGALADGSNVKKIDSEKMALLLGTYAEDARIRREDLRVAVFNTTKTPGLAQKVARVMEKTGFHVVTIANNEKFQPTQCVVQAKKDFFKTVTVQTLVWLYGCSKGEETDMSSSDVTLILGTHFEKRFFPF